MDELMKPHRTLTLRAFHRNPTRRRGVALLLVLGCLSTVFGALFPVSHTTSTYTASQFMPYFALAPKLNVGSVSQTSNLGSNAGTVAPVSGTGSAQLGTGALIYKTSDRLYNSVDELDFQSDLANGLGGTLPGGTGAAETTTYARTSSSNGVSSVIATDNNSTSTVAPQFLEKARFFLTASSRAPDVNLFNQPRIGIWPISATTGTTTRTALDNTMAFCGTIGGLPYYFQRLNAYSGTIDLPNNYTAGDTGVDRNRQLTTYLQNLTGSAIPGFGSGTFLAKYANGDRDQILTEIFDYIRCQNLVDPNVTTPFTGAPTWTGGDDYLNVTPATSFTMSCGPGQVVPIVDANGNSNKGTRGFGRFPTVTEASLMFIVLGWNDASSGHPSTTDPNYYTGTATPAIAPAGFPFTGYPWGYYGTTGTTNPACWAFTGAPGVLSTSTMTPNTVRVQAALILSYFDPSQSYPADSSLFQVQIQGMNNWKWNNTNMGFLSTGLSGWTVSTFGYNQVKWGGIMDYRILANQMSPTQGSGTYKYYPFFSNSIDLPYDPTKGMSMTNPTPLTFSGGTITINTLIPTGVSATAGNTVQTIKLNFPGGTFPCPTYAGPCVDSTGTYDMARWDNRFGKDVNPYSAQTFLFNGNHDVVRSVRFNTDARLIAGLSTVDASGTATPQGSYFTSYAGTETQTLMHSMWLSTGMPLYGASLGQLVNGLTYNGTYPTSAPWGANAGNVGAFMASGYCATQGAFLNNIPNELGDWDNGVGVAADGPYINKADEGDYQYYNSNSGSTVPYFDTWYSNQIVANGGQTFFSPNRMMPSAVMFGSLPTGVLSGHPWQTLLFNPNPAAGNAHPGFGTGSGTAGYADVPPYTVPPDHLFLDLFTMPVVEPYPISEPLSTAGRVNMNYQIVPFTYIERATGVRAVLKPERITAIPDSEVGHYKNLSGTTVTYSADNYRLPINLDATLQGFDSFFSTTNDIFRSASQICNMQLIPSQDADGSTISSSTYTPTTFWSTHRLTGDNSRERPYVDIYPRLTTKSNTFTIHYYVQTLKKVPTTSVTQWVEGTDQVTGEYRGSTTIERYVDPNAAGMPDFASSPNTALDAYYKFRVVSERQFAP
jgi:uncharacterized protein (TIGR02600 family)